MRTNISLENKFFYRLVKVLHILNMTLFFIAISCYLYCYIPSGTIPDNERSYIACENGQKYILNKININLESYEKEFNDEAKKQAQKICVGTGIDYSAYGEINPLPNYSLKLIYKPREWMVFGNALLWCFFVAAIYYSIMNIIREALIYLAFGRKFTWDWLKIIITNARKIQDSLLKS
jgi:hypothetical protein